jgi:hypothetical protein
MKPLFLFVFASMMTLFASAQQAQDKSKRPSPPAQAKQTLESGAVVSIDYSQPSVKGRTIGKDLEPKAGQVWRTGANEATVIEFSKDVTINDQKLAAGKYGLFSLVDGENWTFIFNKTWNQWGAYSYKEADDVLRIKVKADKAKEFAEKMSFNIDKDGKVVLLWGDIETGFKVK